MTKTDTFAKLTKRTLKFTTRELIEAIEAKYPEYKPAKGGYRENVSLYEVEGEADSIGSVVLEYTFTENEP